MMKTNYVFFKSKMNAIYHMECNFFSHDYSIKSKTVGKFVQSNIHVGKGNIFQRLNITENLQIRSHFF